MEVASKSSTTNRNMIYKTKYDVIAYVSVGVALLLGVGIWMLTR
jgi:hypothetical protein